MFVNGVSDYAWAEWEVSPPLTNDEKMQIANLMDGFKSTADVQNWLNTRPAGTDRLAYAVLYFADKQKFISLSPLLTPTMPPPPPPPPPPQTTETPWLLYAGAALVAFLLLRKRG